MTNEFLRTSKGQNDECYTMKYGVEPLLEFLPRFREKIIWCPFDDESSEFVQTFRSNGYNVVCSHIKNGQNFFTYEPENWDLIVSNPPFTGKGDIFQRAISFNKPFALLMTLTWLNDRRPMRLFKDINFQLLMFEDRMNFKNQSQTKAINFSSAYFCRDFLPKDILIRNFNHSQRSLF
jgi:hypothetical protein